SRAPEVLEREKPFGTSAQSSTSSAGLVRRFAAASINLTVPLGAIDDTFADMSPCKGPPGSGRVVLASGVAASATADPPAGARHPPARAGAVSFAWGAGPPHPNPLAPGAAVRGGQGGAARAHRL